MKIELSAEDRTALVGAASGARQVRQWRRYQAILLLADGQTPQAVAQALGASRAGVYNWAAQWLQAALSRLVEGPHVGLARRFDAAGERWLDTTLASDSQTHGYQTPGWTVPLLRRAAMQVGHVVSSATLRRTIRRLGCARSAPRTSWAAPTQTTPKKRRADRADTGDPRPGR